MWRIASIPWQLKNISDRFHWNWILDIMRSRFNSDKYWPVNYRQVNFDQKLVLNQVNQCHCYHWQKQHLKCLLNSWATAFYKTSTDQSMTGNLNTLLRDTTGLQYLQTLIPHDWKRVDNDQRCKAFGELAKAQLWPWYLWFGNHGRNEAWFFMTP